MTESYPNGPSRPSRNYNPIYERLIESPGDDEHELVGFVAYALYKRSKRHWVGEFRTRKGRKPNDQDLDEYVEYWTPDRLAALRSEAVSVLAAFGDYVVAEARPDIMRDAIRGTFWKSVLSSMLAAFIYTLFLIGVAFILSYAGVDFIGIFSHAASATSR